MDFWQRYRAIDTRDTRLMASFLADDSAARSGARQLAAGSGASGHSPDFTARSPWRSYATKHLWPAAQKPAPILKVNP